MNTSTGTSTLTSLRALAPNRNLNFSEALHVAEQQARRLIDLISDLDGISETHIANMPRIKIIREQLPVSGMSYWNGRSWVIALSASESHVRQRFTLLHEFKHIIDHGAGTRLYRGNRRLSADQQAEAAADYFAGCALVGKRELKAAWGHRIQRVEDLAHYFDVSFGAIRVRLAQTGLDVVADKIPAPRCARPVSTLRSRPLRFRAANSQFARRSFT